MKPSTPSAWLIRRHLIVGVLACSVAQSACSTVIRRQKTGTKLVETDRSYLDDAAKYRVASILTGPVDSAEVGLVVERQRACEIEGEAQTTYEVTRERKKTAGTTIMWITGGVGALAGGLASLAFKDKEGDAAFLGNPLAMAPLGFAFGSVFALPFMGPSKGPAVTKELETSSESFTKVQEACEPFTAAPDASGALQLAGRVYDFETDKMGSARIALEIDAWESIADKSGARPIVVLPDGTRRELSIPVTFQRHAGRVVAEQRKLQKPPRIRIRATFDDASGNANDTLDGGEAANLIVRVDNDGGGPARGVVIGLKAKDSSVRVARAEKVGRLEAGMSRTLNFKLRATTNLGNGSVKVLVRVDESAGFGLADPFVVQIPTARIRPPVLRVARTEIFDGESAFAQGNGDGKLNPGEQVELKVKIGNNGKGPAHGTIATVSSRIPSVVFVRPKVKLGDLAPGEAKVATFVFRVPARTKATTIPILFSARQSLDGHDMQKQISIRLGKPLPAGESTIVRRRTPGGSSKAKCQLSTRDLVVSVSEIEDRMSVMRTEALRWALTEHLHDQATERHIQTIPGAQREAELAKLRKESYKECYDEKCQIELGKRLAASHVLTSQVARFGSECTMSWKLIDLTREQIVCGASRRGSCDDKALLELVEDVATDLPSS